MTHHLSLPCLHSKKSVDDKEEDKNNQHTAGLEKVHSSWEGDEAVLVDGSDDRRGREGGDSLKAAHECVHLDHSYQHWSIDSNDQ